MIPRPSKFFFQPPNTNLLLAVLVASPASNNETINVCETQNLLIKFSVYNQYGIRSWYQDHLNFFFLFQPPNTNLLLAVLIASPASNNEAINVCETQNLFNVNMKIVTKLMTSNFLMWSCQVHGLLDGYDLVVTLMDPSSFKPRQSQSMKSPHQTPRTRYGRDKTCWFTVPFLVLSCQVFKHSTGVASRGQ